MSLREKFGSVMLAGGMATTAIAGAWFAMTVEGAPAEAQITTEQSTSVLKESSASGLLAIGGIAVAVVGAGLRRKRQDGTFEDEPPSGPSDLEGILNSPY